jgi:hypothetical protein
MMAKLLALLMVFSIPGIAVYAQTPAEVRINPSQPTVYFTAERLAGENLWLRLHNNSRWAISFEAERPAEISIPYRLADGSEIKSLIEGAEVFPRYEIENPLTGWYREHPCGFSELWLTPGNSALMRVAIEKLRPLAFVYVSINYEWEGDQQRPEHRVKFEFFPETKLPTGN